jgi:hypothetical protein
VVSVAKIRVKIGSLGYNDTVYEAGDVLEVSEEDLKGLDSGDYELVETKGSGKR